MPQPFSALILFPHGLDPDVAVPAALESLEQLGATFDDESVLLLERGGEFLEAPLEEEWQNKLAAWPGIRSVDFALGTGAFLLSFLSYPGSTRLEAVELNTLSPKLGGIDKAVRTVARVLHLVLGAERSIGHFGLMGGQAQLWQHENERLRRGERTGHYELDLVRSSPD